MQFAGLNQTMKQLFGAGQVHLTGFIEAFSLKTQPSAATNKVDENCEN